MGEPANGGNLMAVRKTYLHFPVKVLAYVAIMAALGNALAILSIDLVPLSGSQVALDLSHLATFLSAIPGGPIVGLFTGALVGIYPALAFGYIHGSLGIVGLTLIVGKGITGLTCGAVQRRLKRPLLSVTAGYVPECLFTIAIFVWVVPAVGIMPVSVAWSVVLLIVAKAWIEILFMGFIMESVFLSRGIVHMLRIIFPQWDYTPLSEL
jgi:hypothetical protein